MGCICRSVLEPFDFSVDTISHLQLPQAVSLVVKGVHICHFLGRAVSRLELRQHHPGLYLTGVLTNAQLGDTTFVKVAAQIVRVAQVLFSVVEEGGRLVHSCNRLLESCSLPTWISIPYMGNRLASKEWDLQEGRAPSVLFLPWPLAVIASRIMLIVMRIAAVASHIWQLSLFLFELNDAVLINPYTQSEVIDDLFLNLQDISDQFISKERRLSQAVAEHRQWIDELMKLARVDWSAEKLVSILNGFAEKVEGIANACAAPVQSLGLIAKGASAVASALTTGYSSKPTSVQHGSSEHAEYNS